jgi:hypothetical protein
MNAAPNLGDALTAIEMIDQAVVALVTVCDGANQQDARGFNRFDSDWGHRTAEQIRAGQHPDPVRALRVLGKYRKQLSSMGIELPSPEVVAAAVELMPPPAAAPRASAPSGPTIDVDPNNAARLLVHGTYPRFTDAVRAINGRKWEAELPGKPWSIPIAQLDDALAKMPGAALSPAVVAITDTARQAKVAEIEHQRAEEIRRAAQAKEDLARYAIIKATLERKPFDHQDEGIVWLIERRFAILADDMGLGKTYQALVAARALGHRVIIVCPAGLRPNWIREAEICRVRVEVYSWAKLPQMPKGAFTLIADEAHYAQNLKSARTKKFLAMADTASAVFLLSGTPVKNGRPANLFPLLVAMKHPLAANKTAYEKRYCEARETRWTKWDVTGAAHLEELHSLIADSLLRRMKDEVLDMPGKMRVVRDVRAELSAASRERFSTELDRMVREYHTKKDAKLAALRAELDALPTSSTDDQVSKERERIETQISNVDSADGIVELNILRHASSLAKIETGVEMAEEVIEQGGQVVVFVGFKTAATEIARAIGAGLITGEQSAEERQATVDAFQSGVIKSIVSTLGAGNVGITLTAGRTVILLDRPWTPGDALQAEDRCYRIGQKGSVLAVWVQATESDIGLDALLENKYARSETIIEGEKPTFGLVGDYSKYEGVTNLATLANMLWKDRAQMLSGAE